MDDHLKERIKNSFPYERFFRNELDVSDVQSNSSRLQAACPFHEDKQPSLSITLAGDKRGLLYCHAAGCSFHGGDIFSYFQHKSNFSFWDALKAAGEVCGIEVESKPAKSISKPEINPDLVESYHQNLLNKTELNSHLNFLKMERGINHETICKWKIGHNGQRFIIPVFDEKGKIVNLRKYLPNPTKGQPKFLNHIWKEIVDKSEIKHSFGRNQLYTDWKSLKESEIIVITAGELDGLVLNNRAKIAFASSTSGEGSWNQKYNNYFQDKKIVIAYDLDESGKIGAQKVAESLKNTANEIRIIELPDKVGRGGDLTDFFVRLGLTIDDFIYLVDNPVQIINKKEILTIEKNEQNRTLFEALCNPNYYHTWNKVEATVIGVGEKPLATPEYLELKCHYGINCKAKDNCPVLHKHNGHIKWLLKNNPKAAVTYLMNTSSNMNTSFKRSFDIPYRCFQSIKPSEEKLIFNEVKISPKITLGKNTRDESEIAATMYFCGPNRLRENENYKFYVKPEENPKSHDISLFSNQAIPELDDLDTFKITPEIFQTLTEMFHPKSTDFEKHFIDMANDLLVNQCKLVNRVLIPAAWLWAMFTPQNYSFDGDYIHRGWGSVLIVGDTATGKSQGLKNLNAFCPSFECAVGEKLSLAGLIGGMEKGDKSSIFRLGLLGRCDRRGLWIDEYKDAPPEVTTHLTSVRSEGVILYDKLIHRRFNARVRTIFSTSPYGTKQLENYKIKYNSINQVMQNSREDIRRFDNIIILDKEDVSIEEINTPKSLRETIPQHYTSQGFNPLLKYAWTRDYTNIYASSEVHRVIYEEVKKYHKKYGSDVTILDPKSFRFNLMKMAINMAILCFDVNKKPVEQEVFNEVKQFETGNLLYIRPEYVRAYSQILQKILDDPRIGLKEYTETQLHKEREFENNLELYKLFNLIGDIKLKYQDFHEVLFIQNIRDVEQLKAIFSPENPLKAGKLIQYLQLKGVIRLGEFRKFSYNAVNLAKFKENVERYYADNEEKIMQAELEYEKEFDSKFVPSEDIAKKRTGEDKEDLLENKAPDNKLKELEGEDVEFF
ncbi:CHC2 zinc finger domain-containing protein [Candidatus Margulisiibacteriota bacterium]